MPNCVAEGLKTSSHLGRFGFGSQDSRIHLYTSDNASAFVLDGKDSEWSAVSAQPRASPASLADGRSSDQPPNRHGLATTKHLLLCHGALHDANGSIIALRDLIIRISGQ